jgi:trimethylamine:corrinoid methyltransferase-like protein
MRNHLAGLVADLDTAAIRAGAIRLLAEVGMAVPSAAVRQRLADAGATLRAERVFFAAEAAAGFMDRQKAAAAAEPDELPLRLEPGSHCLHEFCPRQRAIRPLTVESLGTWTRLTGALKDSGTLASAYCPGIPSDVSPRLAPLWQQLIAVRYLVDPPIYAYSPAYAPHASRMAAVLGKRLSVGVHPISPLVLGGDELDLALRLLDEGSLTSVGVAPMPAMGVTAPLDWVAAWAQSLAEAVGTGLALEAMGFDRVWVMATLYVADMAHGTFVYGSAEHAVITLAEARVNRELLGNQRRTAKALNSTAKEPNAQAATEKTAHTLTALLGGYRSLGSVGILAIDEIFSPEQLFIDVDIVEHCWRILRGVEGAFAAGDVVDLVRQGLGEGQFLTTDATLERFRGFYSSPGTFDRRTTGSWLADPVSPLDRARARADAAIAAYTYERDAGTMAELHRIVAQAEKELASA